MRRSLRHRPAAGPQSARSFGHVTLICGVGTGNIGNDASLDVVRADLRRREPSLQVTVATPFPEGARTRLADAVLPLRLDLGRLRETRSGLPFVAAVLSGEVRRLLELHRHLRATDAVIVTGTGILDDFEERPWGMPYALVSWALMTRLHDRPFVLTSIGAGPIEGRLNRHLLTAVARLATRVTFRDVASRDYMSALGAGCEEALVVPDLVYGTTLPAARPIDTQAEHLRVGLGVLDYDGWPRTADRAPRRRYVQTLVEVVEALHAQGHTVSLLCGQPCDESLVQEVVAGCRPHIAAGLECPQTPDLDSLLEVMGDLDLVVATRFHHVVAATMMGRPVVSVSYAPKNGELLRDLGIPDRDAFIEEATSSWVLAQVSRARDLHETEAAGVAATLREWHEQVAGEVRTVLSHVAGRLRRQTGGAWAAARGAVPPGPGPAPGRN